MKRFILTACGCLAFACLSRATVPSYVNYGSVTVVPPAVAPMIDATSFVNLGTFSITLNITNGNGDIPGLNQTNPVPILAPFTCSSVQNYTNRSMMMGMPGFQFDYEPVTVGDAGLSANFVNANLAPNSTNAWIYGMYLVDAEASNVVNSGSVESSSQGLIRMNGVNVDVSRGSIIQDGAGTFNGVSAFRAITSGGYDSYINLYWSNTNALPIGSGINPASFPPPPYTLTAPATPIYSVVTNLSQYFNPMLPQAPVVPVVIRYNGSNSYDEFTGNYQFGAYPTSSITATQWVNDDPVLLHSTRQVLIVHNPNTNVTVQVGSVGGSPLKMGRIYVSWTGTGTNAFALPVTNSIVMSDTLGSQGSNSMVPFEGFYPNAINTTLLNYTAPGGGTPFRPTYEPTNYTFYRVPGPVALPSSTLGGGPYIDGTVLFNTNQPPVFHPKGPFVPGTDGATFLAGNYTFTNVLVTNYLSSMLGVMFTTTNVVAINPYSDYTNLPGRVELCGTNSLNLNNTRVDALDYMLISGTNQFLGNTNATVAVPYSDLFLGSTNGTLTVSKMFVPTIPRLSGRVDVYSCLWTNFTVLITNTDSTPFTNSPPPTNVSSVPIVYNVILVDSALITTTPSEVLHLGLRSTNLSIAESFDIMNGLSLNATTLVIQTNGGFNLLNQNNPFDWVDNFSGPDANPLVFTNLGTITSLYDSGLYFLSQSGPYSNFVNAGTINAQGEVVSANYFENSGTITAATGAINVQSTGKAVFKGGSLNSPASDVFITCNDFCPTNLSLPAGRGLWITAYHSLQPGANFWQVQDGFNLLYSPTNGDFRSVAVTNIAFAYANVQNQWDGIDYGANAAAGYANNGAVGDLILDGGVNSQFTFSGTHRNTSSNALYVDRLDLKNAAALTDVNGNLTSISIKPGMKIYFNKVYTNGTLLANASLNGKHGLDGTNGGAFVALADPAGTLFTLVPGITPSSINLNVALTNGLGSGASSAVSQAGGGTNTTVLISWNTAPNATNYVYFKNHMTDPSWQVLTNFISGAQAGSVSVSDTNGTGGRFYQIRLDVPQ